MAQLTLTGLSRDGKRLLLVDDTGREHTLTVDSVLRAAVRGERDRIGQLEIQMESALRPRDIQARIRAGESPETVAEAAQTSVERIMPYAAPVLAERAHMAERAQSSSVRRRGAEGARTLGEAIAFQLRTLNVDPETVEWDAWRREDGRWTLTALFEAPGRTGLATFAYDVRGSFVTVDDDDARWLIGDAPAAPPSSAPARDELQAARERRLSAARDGSEDLGEDAIELVSSQEESQALHPSAQAPHSPEHPAQDPVAEPAQPIEAYLAEADVAAPTEAPSEAPSVAPAEQSADQAAPAVEEEAAPAPAQPKRTSRRKGRASVPSWDEIMFGGGGGRTD